ncbi:TPM domain-containing protein [Porifericola rhodea]|uniref:TPM domain-containing protein n=1 Tax=Porifericola rhodea TaxID=930972 RepID=UPI002664E4E8|nr:TPM domain-containing protein [Porifericola rhodea]WKN30068.1 TPM domain-containing protein [Porifericola rhodea]
MAYPLFSKEESLQIKNAVVEAEKLSAGEIVPVISRQASWYEQSLWRAGALFSLITGMVLTIIYLSSESLLWLPPYLWLLICTTGGIAGATLAESLSVVKRFFISNKTMQQAVENKARQLFVEQGVSHTEQRSGILLFVSYFEKQAVILPDLGISELVEQKEWENVLQKMINTIRSGHTTQAICDAIKECGALLEASGIQKAIDDQNQLPDEVQIDD